MPKSRSAVSTEPVVFEPEFTAALTDIFETRIVFNQMLGMKKEEFQMGSRDVPACP